MSEITVLSRTQHLFGDPPEEVRVISRTQRIIVDSIGGVTIVNAGPPGPSGEPGPPGPSGPSGGSMVYQQSDPASVWNIVHDLGFYPNVTVVDSGGTIVEGTVSYIDLNTLSVTFTVEFGGKAYLS